MSNKLSVTEAFRLIIKRAGKSMSGISRDLDMGTPANVVNMISRGQMKINTGSKIAAECGYKIILVPIDEDVENGIEIEGE